MTGANDHHAGTVPADDRGLAGRHVLVTGGAGFIGSHMTEALVAAGARVTVVDDLRTSSVTNLDGCRDAIDYVEDDVLDDRFESLVRSRRFDVVVHLAGNPYVPPSVERPWDDFQLNLTGTLRLLETLRKTGSRARVLLASSAAVYGDLDVDGLTEEHPTVPISPYGVSKLGAERYGAVYAQLYGLRVASLRYFSVYGPRQKKQVVYDLLGKLLGGTGDVLVHGDGTQTRDFNYVTDVVGATLAVAASAPLRGETYNVAGGQVCSIRELVETLAGLVGSAARIRWSGVVRPGDPQRWSADWRRLAALGWQPRVSLRDGLASTVSWYRTYAERIENRQAV
ncbi:MAG TPA: GDP-mannose 4,6-dehydratase [Methylomirabilota bacterium]